MAVIHGENFALYVRTATSPDVFTVVNDINRFGKRSNRSVTSHAVFKRSTAYSVPGAREVTFTAAGFYNAIDTGQNYLRTAEQTNAVVTIRVIPDDTAQDGFDQQVRVGSTNFDATPEDLSEYGFEFTAMADAVIIATTGKLF